MIYLACSPKSNSAYKSINEAQEEIRNSGSLSVPFHLRNSGNKLMDKLKYEREYSQEFMPKTIRGKCFYRPAENIKETKFRQELKKIWKGKYNY